MNAIDMGAQAAAITIRKEVEAPASGAIIGADAAAFLFMPDDVVEAHRKIVATAEACWDTCIENLQYPDTPTATKDKHYTALRKSEAAWVESSDGLRDWLDANMDRLVEEHKLFVADAAAQGLAAVGKADVCATIIAQRSMALARSRDKRKSLGWSPLPSRVRVVGGDSIHNLQVAFEALQEKPDPVRVSPAAMAALQRGEATTDIDGNDLTFEHAEELHKLGLLKVNYGPLNSRGSGPRE